MSIAKVTFIKVVGKCTVLLPTIFINVTLAMLKCKLPDDGRRPRNVGAVLI